MAIFSFHPREKSPRNDLAGVDGRDDMKKIASVIVVVDMETNGAMLHVGHVIDDYSICHDYPNLLRLCCDPDFSQ